VARTPAIAAAEQAKIAHSVHAYEHDPKAESYGLEAAERMGVDPARVFKTLVVDLDGSLEVAVVPVASQLDLRALGGKRSRMAEPRDVERSTGYVLGGVSPLGQRRRLPTTVDSSALGHETVFVSAGRRGLELELDPNDLVQLTGASVRPIARQAIG
jgi:Cys-tRNA(Pro)/Cys-tRNA(Cys) deacylase